VSHEKRVKRVKPVSILRIHHLIRVTDIRLTPNVLKRIGVENIALLVGNRIRIL